MMHNVLRDALNHQQSREEKRERAGGKREKESVGEGDNFRAFKRAKMQASTLCE
jgi:hypothetical protein